MQIIAKDTTWGAGQVINLTENVQVAPGVTLTIDPGAQITGSPWVLPVENPPKIYSPINLQVYGTLKAQGTFGSEILFDMVILKLSDDSNYNGSLLLDRVEIKGVPISPPTGNGVYGSFNLTNSVIHDVAPTGGDYWYAWYPQGINKINNNIFIRQQAISLGISTGSIEISNNIFDHYNYCAVTEWAAYGTTPILSNNAYLMSGSPTLALNYDGKLISNGDYFGGATQDQIGQMIYDRNDTLTISK